MNSYTFPRSKSPVLYLRNSHPSLPKSTLNIFAKPIFLFRSKASFAKKNFSLSLDSLLRHRRRVAEKRWEGQKWWYIPFFLNEINSMKLAIWIWFGVIVKITYIEQSHARSLQERQNERETKRRKRRSKENSTKVQTSHSFSSIFLLDPFLAFSIDQSTKRSNLINWWRA